MKKGRKGEERERERDAPVIRYCGLSVSLPVVLSVSWVAGDEEVDGGVGGRSEETQHH